MSEADFLQKYSQGSPIFRECDPGDCAFVIESGRVEITARSGAREVFIRSFGEGEIFGEMAMIDDLPRSATATAVEDTVLTVIRRDQLRERMEQADPVLNLFLGVLLEHLRTTNDRLMGGGASGLSDLPSAAFKMRHLPYGKDRERALDAIKLEQDLSLSLQRNEFEVYYQPIIDLAERRIAGFEALLRWHHPERGIIPPNDFIPLAETTGVIVPLGLWVFEEACRTLLVLQDSRPRNEAAASSLFMSINISGHQLSHLDIIGDLGSALTVASVDPTLIKLEITETVLLENPDHAAKVLARVKELGVKLALDDFGTGYSSLSYLHQFPIDDLKIDRSFISTMMSKPENLEIVRAIVGLSHNLNLAIIAEGIERPEEAAMLRELESELGQGYLFSKPVMADEAIELLKSGASW